jgi:hypothetical protein
VQVAALGDARRGIPAVEEVGCRHPGPLEDVRAHVVAVAHARDTLEREAGEHVADVAVAADDARLGVRLLVHELRQEVGGVDDGVVGRVAEQLLVALAGLLVRVIRDAAGVGQQVQQVHAHRDLGALEVHVVVDRQLQIEVALRHLLQHGHAREQLRDRRGVETGVDGVRHVPARGCQACGPLVHRPPAPLHRDRAREVFVGDEAVEAAEVHVVQASGVRRVET